LLFAMEDLNHLRPSRPGQPVVLVADDEVIIRNLVRIALESAGLFVLAAADGDEALQMSRKFPGAIHVLVSDVKMPRIDGIALRRQLLLERPTTKVLLMSGAVDQPLEGVPFLHKPFHIEEMKQRVRELLASGATRREK
jgi:CheY-like chemotaxis protein